ncbi:hypothetical protein Tco_0617194 [Tanacetum coccineum]
MGIESTIRETRRLWNNNHVTFDERHQTMALVSISSGPEPVMIPLDTQVILVSAQSTSGDENSLHPMLSWCCFHTDLSKSNPRNSNNGRDRRLLGFKHARWKFRNVCRLEVWELVTSQIYVYLGYRILKWILQSEVVDMVNMYEKQSSRPSNIHLPNAANNNRIIYKMDVKTAFVKWSIFKEEVIVVSLRYQASTTKKHLELMQMRDHAVLGFEEEVRQEVLSFLEIDWLAGHQRSKEARPSQQQRRNTLQSLTDLSTLTYYTISFVRASGNIGSVELYFVETTINWQISSQKL